MAGAVRRAATRDDTAVACFFLDAAAAAAAAAAVLNDNGGCVHDNPMDVERLALVPCPHACPCPRSSFVSIPGGEAVIPGLKAMVDIGSELGIENYIFGMAHR